MIRMLTYYCRLQCFIVCYLCYLPRLLGGWNMYTEYGPRPLSCVLVAHQYIEI